MRRQVVKIRNLWNSYNLKYCHILHNFQNMHLLHWKQQSILYHLDHCRTLWCSSHTVYWRDITLESNWSGRALPPVTKNKHCLCFHQEVLKMAIWMFGEFSFQWTMSTISTRQIVHSPFLISRHKPYCILTVSGYTSIFENDRFYVSFCQWLLLHHIRPM